MNENTTIRGFKVTDSDMTCRGFKYELGKDFKITGRIELCDRGFHFCQQPQHCFNYYDFKIENRVFEIEACGKIEHGEDKSVCSEIKFIREIPWQQVLTIVNTGVANTGHSNSGDRNSGDRNSGDSNSGNRNSGNRNSGNRNSGDWNSGYSNSGDSNSGNSNSGNSNSGNWNSGNRNSGDSNSGNSNSGNSNSGNWNSGNRNSGDSNSGYRNSGAFCTDADPVLYLFDKPAKIKVKEWENSEAVDIMSRIDPTIWVPANIMSEDEKNAHPKWETTEGYLKTIPIHEAWANLWGNLSDTNKRVFTTLENFDPEKFKTITGITI